MSSTVARSEFETRDILWFVARGSVMKGPFTTDQVQAKVKTKEISYLDFCWRQGFREWRPIGSIEDFDRRGQLRSLPHYPSVEVPGSSVPTPEPASVFERAGRYVFNRSAKEGEPQQAKRFEITFARVKRHSISIYEWGFCAGFAVILAYFATDFALNEVEHELTRKLQLWTVPMPSQQGAAYQATGPWAWDPLLSAPSFNETLEPPPSMYDPTMVTGISLPVKVEGVLRQHGRDFVIGGKTAIFPSPPITWSADDSGLDPIYYKPLILKGHLNARQPASIVVDQPGEPYLPAAPAPWKPSGKEFDPSDDASDL